MNLSNKEEQSSVEAGEERARAKENIARSNTSPTQSGVRVTPGLRGVRQAARERKQERFTALLHHLTIDLLRNSFLALKRQAAPGVDGVTWKEYETGLEDRLTTNTTLFQVTCLGSRLSDIGLANCGGESFRNAVSEAGCCGSGGTAS